jgi:hypothetical protein
VLVELAISVLVVMEAILLLVDYLLLQVVEVPTLESVLVLAATEVALAVWVAVAVAATKAFPTTALTGVLDT